MKKALKIIGITIVVLFAALLILPFAFQGKLVEIVKKEANEMLNAKLDFDKLNLSFIRNFPKATVSLQNLSLVGIGEFEGDTLVAADKISATVNIMSLFGDSGFEISKVLLERPIVNAIVLQGGQANWNIMKESETTETTTEESTEPSTFKLVLKNFQINNAAISYSDNQAKMKAVVQNLNMSLSGDMTADITTLKTLVEIGALNFSMDNISYLSKAKLVLDMAIAADLKENKFTFDKNTVRLNAIEAGFDGWFAMLDEGFDMDIMLNTSKIDFKQILSLIPAIYAKDFDKMQASGEVSMSAMAKGKMVGDDLPMMDVKLLVNNGRFQYPELPKSVDNINVNAEITHPGGVADLMNIEVKKFHFEIAKNPFDINLRVATPLTDAVITGAAKGKIDLGMVKNIYPLGDSVSLNGLLTADLSFGARLSEIEKEQYENISANGFLTLNNMLYKTADMPDVQIDKAALNFTPRYVALSDMNVKIGRNDISANGRLENFIPFVLKNALLKGSLNVQSNYFNANDFMSGNTEVETAQDSSVMMAFEVPKNIDFTLDASFKEVVFDNLNMKNTSGKVLVKDGKVELKNLKTNALDGTIILNGYYSTATDPKKPEVNMDIDIREASYSETFKSFDMVKKIAPIFEAIGGKYSVKLDMKTLLDEHFSPDLAALAASGTLQSKEVDIQNVKALQAMAKALNNEKLANLSVKDLKLPFSITDGRVHTKPFDMNTGVGKMNLTGSTGIDQTIDYSVKLDLPENTLNGKAGNLKANVKIKGTFANPKIEIDTQEMINQVVDEAKAEANEKISEELQKQIDKIKEEADKQGKKLIEEAEKVSNPLARAAAVATAKQTANKLNEEAEKQAQSLLGKAQLK